jgi:hypothetical protein
MLCACAQFAPTPDGQGNQLADIDTPIAKALRGVEGLVDRSLANQLVVTDDVIAGGFGEGSDDAHAPDPLSAANSGHRSVNPDRRTPFAHSLAGAGTLRRQPERNT